MDEEMRKEEQSWKEALPVSLSKKLVAQSDQTGGELRPHLLAEVCTTVHLLKTELMDELDEMLEDAIRGEEIRIRDGVTKGPLFPVPLPLT